MPYFNWNTAVPNIPQAWRETLGAGVKIAFLDSGANLTVPSLEHLNVPGHKYYVARPDFNVQEALASGGNDDVTDQASFGEMHGTSTLSIIAGRSTSQTEGVVGVAPDAEVFIFKIMDSDAMYKRSYVLDAIEIALAKNVDIIVCSILPSFNGEGYTEGRRDLLFQKIKQKNVALITTLDNTTLLPKLTKLRFPSDQPESIVTGAVQVPVLLPKPQPDQIFGNIDFLTTPVKVVCYRSLLASPFPLTTCSSSLATAAVAGVAALGLSVMQERPNQEALIAELKTAFNGSYDPIKMLQQTVPGFFHA